AVKNVLFEVSPGPRYARVEIDFAGVEAFEPEELRTALRDADLWLAVQSDSPDAETYLEELYRSEGYLDVDVGSAMPDFDRERRIARFIVPVEEGAQYRIRTVLFEGGDFFEDADLAEIAAIEGAIYTAERLQTATAAIRELYWN